MDQLGFVVRKIESDGFVRLERVGGVPERALASQAVLFVIGEGRDRSGVIANKSHHATLPDEKYQVVPYRDLYVDTGLDSAEAVRAAGIEIGTPVVYEPRVVELSASRIAGTAIDDRVESYSGGMKRRLDLAMSLIHRPQILFLDEPTSGVDPLARRQFWRQINALVESGVTVLVTTHFLQEAEYCDRLVILAEGEILAEGSPGEVKSAAQQPGTARPDMEDAFITLIEQHSQSAKSA